MLPNLETHSLKLTFALKGKDEDIRSLNHVYLWRIHFDIWQN